MALDLMTAGYLLAAALIAAAIRLLDTPKDTLIANGVVQWGVVVPAVVGAIIAVPLAAWILAIDVLVPAGFISLVGLGVAGMAAVKAILGLANKA